MKNRVDNDELYEYIINMLRENGEIERDEIVKSVQGKWDYLNTAYIRSHLMLMCKAHKMIDECYIDNMKGYKVKNK